MRTSFFKPFLICFVVISLEAQAQEMPNSYYLDDNELSSKENLLKIDITSPLRGQYMVCYERFLSKLDHISGEIGIGYLNSQFKSAHINIGENNFKRFDLSEPGYAISWAFNYHPHQSFHKKYYGLKASYNWFDEIKSTQFLMYRGHQINLTDWIVLDMLIGMAIEIYDPKHPDENWYSDVDKHRVLLDVIIKLDYLF